MHDARFVGGLNARTDLRDDVGDLRRWKGSVAARVLLQQLPGGPLDGEIVHPAGRFTDLDGPHDVRVNHALAKMGFAQKALHGRAVVSKLLAQHLYGHLAMDRMPGAKHGGRATFADLTLERVTREGTPDQILTWHGREPNRAREGRQASEALD